MDPELRRQYQSAERGRRMTEPQAHLLVVDDDERIRGLLQKFLIRNGFLVTIARDAARRGGCWRGWISTCWCWM